MVMIFGSLATFLILIYSVILHEISHGFVAERFGDPTARLAGRLTLDPRPHIDPWMTIVLPLVLFLSQAGVVFGAAKPVPVDAFNFRDPKKDMAIVALAGPVTNLLIAVLFSLLLRIVPVFVLNDQLLEIIKSIFVNSILLNVVLALFNLFPIPPLDGSKVLAGLLPNSLAMEIYRLERFGFLLIFAILLLFPGILYSYINPLEKIILSILLR